MFDFFLIVIKKNATQMADTGSSQEIAKDFFFYFLLFGLCGYWHCGHSWPIVSASGDTEDDCGEADEM
jgi:hypothetical protein